MPKRSENRDIDGCACIPIFIQHYSQGQSGNNPDVPQQMKGFFKMWYIQVKEYYLALKRNCILTHGIMGDSQGSEIAKWSMLDTKGCIVYDSTYLKYLKSKNHRDRRYNGGFQQLKKKVYGKLMLTGY